MTLALAICATSLCFRCIWDFAFLRALFSSAMFLILQYFECFWDAWLSR